MDQCRDTHGGLRARAPTLFPLCYHRHLLPLCFYPPLLNHHHRMFDACHCKRSPCTKRRAFASISMRSLLEGTSVPLISFFSSWTLKRKGTTQAQSLILTPVLLTHPRRTRPRPKSAFTLSRVIWPQRHSDYWVVSPNRTLSSSSTEEAHITSCRNDWFVLSISGHSPRIRFEWWWGTVMN